MNITISKRAKSHNPLQSLKSRQIQNLELLPQYLQKQLNKNPSLNTTIRQQQQAQCGKWLFQKCLRKPSRFGEQIIKVQSISLKKTKAVHNISLNKSKKGMQIQREHKINLISKKNAQHEQSQHLKILLIDSQSLSKGGKKIEKLNNSGPYLQKGNDGLDTRYASIFGSYVTSNQNSKQKIKVKISQFSLNPSKIIQLGESHKVKSANKSKLSLSNQLKTSINQSNTQILQSKKEASPYQTYKYSSKPISQQMISDQLSRFEIIYPSQSQFKIVDPNTSNHSINTSYIRKKIQFSSDFSQKNKFQNYIYQPIYMVNDYKDQKALTETVKKVHRNSYSQFIKIVNFDDECYLNSAKLNSEQSIVLEKGLQQIFNNSPTFKKISQSDKASIENQEQNMTSEERESLRNILYHYQKYDEVIQQ